MAIARLCACALALLQLACSLTALPMAMDSLQPQRNRRGGPEALRQQQRSRRRVADLDTPVQGPTEYMQQLYSSLANEEGRPRNASYDPTDIWCILDKGELLADLHALASARLGNLVVRRSMCNTIALRVNEA